MAATPSTSPEGPSSFSLTDEFLANGSIPVHKYQSSKTGLNVYFADVDSQVINGYFCFGVDQPEASGIETLLWHLDSSGGLLPRPLRGDILRPAWQFHGAENPLADRDQSCYVCCALGETAFMGTFSCCTYLLQNLEAVFEIHNIRSRFQPLPAEDENANTVESIPEPNTDEPMADPPPPEISPAEVYCLSEGGEGAMAWEATLQYMFSGVRAFENRLLSDSKNRMGSKMRNCYDLFYRPENLTVVITGNIKERDRITEVLEEYEKDYLMSHPHMPKFERPWTAPFPALQPAKEITVNFVPKSPLREPGATICFGWRGCSPFDWEKAMAVKTVTAYLAVGPLWDDFVVKGIAHRISWCQLEYADTCSLITFHGIKSNDDVDAVVLRTPAMIKELADTFSNERLDELKNMADRVGWHYVREMECDPYLIIASAISKAERYGDKKQIVDKLQPRTVFENLMSKPASYWLDILETYFVSNPTIVTKVVPKVYGKSSQEPVQTEGTQQSEKVQDMNYVAGSKRASTRPRRKNANPVAEESNVPADEDTGRSSSGLEKGDKKEPGKGESHLQEVIKQLPFPFGAAEEDIKELEHGLKVTTHFLEHVVESRFKEIDIDTYETGQSKQHSRFPLNSLPYYTYLEDVKTSFVYLTAVLDTSHLSDDLRKYVAPLTAALGAVVCPRPPGLDTDADIQNPNEFNLPKDLMDSQVSLGLNGEMMQSIFLTLIVRPEKYTWAVQMLHYLLNTLSFEGKFLRFVANEAARGLTANYKMQSINDPKYDYFDGSEINLHSLVKMIYKPESNARLFIGRRRLDLIMEFLAHLETTEAACVQQITTAWKDVVNKGKIVIQIAGDINEICERTPNKDLVAPWKVFGDKKPPTEISLTMEKDLMNEPGKNGILVTSAIHQPCLSLAIPICPNDANFAKLCLTAQLFSLAQKWVWACLDEDDKPAPVLRMPCSYANVLTMNLDSDDVIGAFEIMKLMMKGDWPWLSCLLTATKLMVVNDPAALELGTQGAISSALLAHLSKQDLAVRRSLLIESLKTTVEDVGEMVKLYLSKLMDPKSCWFALLTNENEKDKLLGRLKDYGFTFNEENLKELCSSM